MEGKAYRLKEWAKAQFYKLCQWQTHMGLGKMLAEVGLR